MKNSTAYVLFIVLLLGIALWSQVSRPRRFVWMPTYSHYDTQPFGCAVFDSVLSFSLPQGYEVINSLSLCWGVKTRPVCATSSW